MKFKNFYIEKKKCKKKIQAEDELKGGLADDKNLEDIATKHKVNIEDIKAQVKKGLKVEMEHTANKTVAMEIVKDHLMEDPLYYDKLEKIEN